jgi:hypothetical protein
VTPPEYRWLATSMMSDQLGDVYKMIQADQLEFAGHGFRDLSDRFVVTPVAER